MPDATREHPAVSAMYMRLQGEYLKEYREPLNNIGGPQPFHASFTSHMRWLNHRLGIQQGRPQPEAGFY